MSDDSFIREVNEELRQDQLRALWRRYGTMAIAAAAFVILATAAYVGYQYWTTARANQAGDAFARALDLMEEGDAQGALAAFEALEVDGYGAYPVLARLGAAATLADSEPQKAIARYDAVAQDSAVPGAIRDIARLRAAFLLLDHGSYDDVAARVEPLTAEGNAMRHSARELLALAAFKAGERENALSLFEQILDDPQAPAGIRQRAEMMSELIVGSGSASG